MLSGRTCVGCLGNQCDFGPGWKASSSAELTPSAGFATIKPVGRPKCLSGNGARWPPNSAGGWTIFFDRDGLAFWLETEIVTALGPEHAVTERDRVFDRITRRTWVNPYAKETMQ